MRVILRILLGLFLLVAILVAVVLGRTFALRPSAAAASGSTKVAAPIAVDVSLAARHLSQAVQIQTVSHQDPADDQPGEWDRLQGFLQGAYPSAHAAMTREVVGKHTLVYTWPGSDPSLAPIVLMAHQDVVPVTAGTEAAWKHPPFGGVIADGAVWGRGSIDDKGSLITLFEGVESLAKAGFKPRRTVMVVSGEDEEVHGLGARAAAALLMKFRKDPSFVVKLQEQCALRASLFEPSRERSGLITIVQSML
jgi:carboxypeptidase PM20D1